MHTRPRRHRISGRHREQAIEKSPFLLTHRHLVELTGYELTRRIADKNFRPRFAMSKQRRSVNFAPKTARALERAEEF